MVEHLKKFRVSRIVQQNGTRRKCGPRMADKKFARVFPCLAGVSGLRARPWDRLETGPLKKMTNRYARKYGQRISSAPYNLQSYIRSSRTEGGVLIQISPTMDCPARKRAGTIPTKNYRGVCEAQLPHSHAMVLIGTVTMTPKQVTPLA